MSATEMRVSVKPLDWRKSNVAERWTAPRPFGGEYEIILNTRDVEYWSPQLGGLGVCWNTLDAAMAAAQADYEAGILSALVSPTPAEGEAVPVATDGWVLVPREPTEAMLDAGVLDHRGEVSYDEASAVYGAMIAASPASPPITEQGEAAIERVAQAVKPYTQATLFVEELRDLIRAALASVEPSNGK